MVGLAMSKEQIQAEMARQRAIQNSGYKFIELRLIDRSKRYIQGARILNAFPYRDVETNLPNFKFVEQGGPIQFILNELMGGFYAQLLDVPWNRRFLATHYDSKYWEIVDKMVDAEIADLARKIKLEVKVRIEQTPVEPISEEANLSDDEIEAQLLRYQQEKLRREQQKRDLQTKRPMRRTKPSENKKPMRKKKTEVETPPEIPDVPIGPVDQPQSEAVTVDVTDD